MPQNFVQCCARRQGKTQECINGAVPEPQGLEFAAHSTHGVVLQCIVSDVKQMMAHQYITFEYCTVAKARVEHGNQPPVRVPGVGVGRLWDGASTCPGTHGPSYPSKQACMCMWT